MTTMRNIQWPRAKYWDRAWNPIIGCKPCSPACENCYAAAQMRRFGAADFSPRITTRVNPPRKGVVFCGNMTDLFGEWLWPGSEGAMLYGMGDSLHRAKDGTATAYLWLTKRAERMSRTLQGHRMPPNHFFGLTAENQEWYDRRRNVIYHDWPSWANLWISAEPLLGEIELYAGNVVAGRRLSWVVVGCESGPRRRPCKVEWVESVVEQCVSFGVPVFVKQLDLGGRCVTDINRFPEHLRIRQVPWRRP